MTSQQNWLISERIRGEIKLPLNTFHLITILCIRLNERCLIHMFTICFVRKGASEAT